MSKQVLAVRFKKKNGKLVLENLLSKEQYRLFELQVKENDYVNAIFEIKRVENIKLHLAKIHVCIKELADEMGDTASNVKKQVKRDCGMSYIKDGDEEFESFGTCSKAELQIVIEVIIQMGNFLGMNLTGYLNQD